MEGIDVKMPEALNVLTMLNALTMPNLKTPETEGKPMEPKRHENTWRNDDHRRPLVRLSRWGENVPASRGDGPFAR